MLCLKEGWPSKPRFGAICALVFHQTIVFLSLTHRCAGKSQVVGPLQQIVVFVGDDIMLPCHLEPAMDTSDMTVEWTRPDLNPRFVHVWRDGVELETKKHPSYVGRTSLSINKLTCGDISLKLHRVKLSDEGRYRCFVPTLNTESTFKLVVGSVSSLMISLMKTENDEGISEVVLLCKSTGWYPEPGMSWLDGEGNLLPAGPTETVRGPDDLYTVSSRVTVEKRHSNSFTCRVQQKDINQSRETQIHIPDDFFNAPSSYAAHIAISSTVVFMVILGVVLIVWKWRWRQNRNNLTTGRDNTELHLLTEEKREALQVKNLDEKKANLDLQLKEVEEKHKEVEELFNLLTDHKKDVGEQLSDLIFQRIEKQRHVSQSQPEENNMKHPKETQSEKECLDTETNLGTVIKELQKKIDDTDTIFKAIFGGVCIVKEKKTELETLREEINKQLEEIEEQRNEIEKKFESDHPET